MISDYKLRGVHFVAENVPFKQTKGRAGEVLYKRLYDPANKQEYSWAYNHTWQSWNNRYKKNQPKFDRLIDDYLEANPEILDNWEADKAVSKKVARKLGYDTARYSDDLSNNSGDDGDPQASISLTSQTREEELEVDALISDSRQQRKPAAPAQEPIAKKSKRIVSQRRRERDVNEFPDVRMGDDTAPPAWARRTQASDPNRSRQTKGTPARRSPSLTPESEDGDDQIVERQSLRYAL